MDNTADDVGLLDLIVMGGNQTIWAKKKEDVTLLNMKRTPMPCDVSHWSYKDGKQITMPFLLMLKWPSFVVFLVLATHTFTFASMLLILEWQGESCTYCPFRPCFYHTCFMPSCTKYLGSVKHHNSLSALSKLTFLRKEKYIDTICFSKDADGKLIQTIDQVYNTFQQKKNILTMCTYLFYIFEYFIS